MIAIASRIVPDEFVQAIENTTELRQNIRNLINEANRLGFFEAAHFLGCAEMSVTDIQSVQEYYLKNK